MKIQLEELTHNNYHAVRQIRREDVPESFVNTVDTIMRLTDYSVAHGCLGHTFAVKLDGSYIGLILLGEAIPWPSDPPQMAERPFYRLMGFVIDKQYRGMGIGGTVLEQTIERVYRDFGPRPIALGCHRDNHTAAVFYRKHGFQKTEYLETEDYYYLRYPEDDPKWRELLAAQAAKPRSEADAEAPAAPGVPAEPPASADPADPGAQS